jgi:hypothetical protein
LGIASKYIDFTNASGFTIELGQPGAGGEGDGTTGAGAPGKSLPFAMFPK